MSYSAEQRKANADKKALTQSSKSIDKTDVEEKTVQPKKKLVLNDNVSISVSSNVFGLLTYVNHKTGDVYKWQSNSKNDAQSLYVSDIRAMKSNQPRFLEENWILIEGIADKDEAYDGVTVEEIYEALQISHYYKDTLCPKNLNDIFNWSASDIKSKVPKMKQSIKESLIVRANELIKEGILDSIAKVKALETALNCELVSPED